jgi:hypothetical protein
MLIENLTRASGRSPLRSHFDASLGAPQGELRIASKTKNAADFTDCTEPYFEIRV